MTYFQPVNNNSDTATVNIKEKFISKIQPGDILNIRVFSLSQEANAMFNVFPTEEPVIPRVHWLRLLVF